MASQALLPCSVLTKFARCEAGRRGSLTTAAAELGVSEVGVVPPGVVGSEGLPSSAWMKTSSVRFRNIPSLGTHCMYERGVRVHLAVAMPRIGMKVHRMTVWVRGMNIRISSWGVCTGVRMAVMRNG